MSAVRFAAGQVWRHRREPWRSVTLRIRVDVASSYPGWVVSRNTSRRTQSIRETTLLRDYRQVSP